MFDTLTGYGTRYYSKEYLIRKKQDFSLLVGYFLERQDDFRSEALPLVIEYEEMEDFKCQKED